VSTGAVAPRLETIWRWFLKMNVLSFTTQAQARFTELKRGCPRLKTMDLRIASIALVTDSTLLSRNLRDFRQVPGLSVEDWTAAGSGRATSGNSG
jgi:tRNA(fMet)-specific endonuclease VapC